MRDAQFQRYQNGNPIFTIPYSVYNRSMEAVEMFDLQVLVDGTPYVLQGSSVGEHARTSGSLDIIVQPGWHDITLSVSHPDEEVIDGKNKGELSVYKREQATVLKESLDFFVETQIGKDARQNKAEHTVMWEDTKGTERNPIKIYLLTSDIPQFGLLAMSNEAISITQNYLEQWPTDLLNYELVDSHEEADMWVGAMDSPFTNNYGANGVNFTDEGIIHEKYSPQGTNPRGLRSPPSIAVYNINANYTTAPAINGFKPTLAGTLSAELFATLTGLSGEKHSIDLVGTTVLTSIGARTDYLTPFDIAQARIVRALGPGVYPEDVQGKIDADYLRVADENDPATRDEALELKANGVYSSINKGTPVTNHILSHQ